MQFGFSIVGVVFLAMLFVPNIIWGKHQPPGYAEISKNENRILLALERIGEVATSCAAAIVLGVGHIGIHLGHVRDAL